MGSRKGLEAPRSQAEYGRKARGGLGKKTVMISVAEGGAPFFCVAGRSREGLEAPRSQAEYSRKARGGLRKETAMMSVAEGDAPFFGWRAGVARGSKPLARRPGTAAKPGAG